MGKSGEDVSRKIPTEWEFSVHVGSYGIDRLTRDELEHLGQAINEMREIMGNCYPETDSIYTVKRYTGPDDGDELEVQAMRRPIRGNRGKGASHGEPAEG